MDKDWTEQGGRGGAAVLLAEVLASVPELPLTSGKSTCLLSLSPDSLCLGYSARSVTLGDSGD